MRKSKPFEFSATVNLTTECNQSCIFCRASETFPEHSKITEENFRKILEWLGSYSRVEVIEFCGGEPTLHEELINLIKMANKSGYHVMLLTNGTRLKKLVPELKKLQVSVQVSVEAPYEELHNKIVGRVSFKDMVAGVREAVRKGIDISTNSTMNTLNYNHVLEIIEFFRKIGVRGQSVNYLVPNKLNTRYALSYEKISDIFRRVRYYGDVKGIKITTLNPIPYCLGYNDRPCSAGSGCVIEPSLDVYPCLFTQWEDLKMGNLAKDTPESLMESAPYKLFAEKKYLPEKCKNCRLYRECSGGCYAFWRYGLLSPDNLRIL